MGGELHDPRVLLPVGERDLEGVHVHQHQPLTLLAEERVWQRSRL